MSTSASESSSVKVELPTFVAIALQILPRFLEAIQGNLWTLKSLDFSPSQRTVLDDPQRGRVKFEGYGGSSITFWFVYRPGEEGTRGSLSQLERIVYQVGELPFTFEYLEHRCLCHHCPGTKYPFRPHDLERHSFEHYGDDQKLLAIRRYVELA